MNHLLLDCLALGAILSGVLVITSKNPVISVLFLISVFVNVAGYLVLLGVGFIGISYLIVYVGAVAILFLFVVMMLNLQLAELSAVGSEYTQSLPLGAIVGSLFLFELGSVLPFSYKDVGSFFSSTEGVQGLLPNLHLGLFNWFNTTFLGLEDTSLNGDVQLAFNAGVPDTQVASFLQIQSIGHMLYTTGTVWLMLASVILMLAMVGPISLSMDKRVAL
jgi:NADH-ubiquinone oxidoreductase chain 6